MKFPRPGTRPLDPLIVLVPPPPALPFTPVLQESVWWELLRAARRQTRPNRALRDAIEIILEGTHMKKRLKGNRRRRARKARYRKPSNLPTLDTQPFLPGNQPRKAPNTSLSRKGWVK